MPFESKAQRRFMYAKHPEMAKRWEAHTPKGKKLPEHKGDKTMATKKAEFIQAFLNRAAREGVVGVAALTKLAQDMQKRASVDGVFGAMGNALPWAAAVPIMGTVVAPAVAGYAAGNVAGHVRNDVDRDDAKNLQISALANAYRRQAAVTRSNAQVRQLIASDPKKYVMLG